MALRLVWWHQKRDSTSTVWSTSCIPQHVTCKTSDFTTLEIWGHTNFWYVDYGFGKDFAFGKDSFY